jgi:dCMP deaminase
MVVHCERNAILFAQRDLTGCTLYTWPFMSCAPCAGMVIQAGIRRVVAPMASDELAARWAQDLETAYTMFLEAGVVVSLLESTTWHLIEISSRSSQDPGRPNE